MDDGRQETSMECPGCRERDARIAELERPLAELKRKLEQLTRDSQRQTARFPRRKVIPPDQHKTPGRKPGHDGAFRAIPKKVHRTIHVPCATCPCCGKYRQGRHEEQITDPTPVVTNVLGPRALGMAADWKHRLGIVYRKISELFDTCVSLNVSAGTLSRAEVRFARRALPTYEWLIEALRQAAIGKSCPRWLTKSRPA